MAPVSSHNPRRMRQRNRVQGDDRVGPSTPQRGTSSSTRLGNIPNHVVEEAADSLRGTIYPKDDDERILNALNLVRMFVIIALEQDQKLKEHLASKDEFRDNITALGEGRYARKQSLGVLKKMSPPDVDPERPLHKATTPAQEATERAWQRAFKGEAATVLLETISSYLDKERDPYARQATIVNSSGTGKSRMVDELATEIITIPMCLRPGPSTGYPPPDAALRSWLLSGEISDNTLGTIRKRLHGFVYALLTVTRTTLGTFDSKKGKITNAKDVKLRQAKLASTFRDRMTEGQSYQGSNAYRKNFYKRVTQLADEFIEDGQQINGPKDTKQPKQPKEFYPYVSKDEHSIERAGNLLAQFVDPDNFLDRNKERPRRPLIIFAFDEAHILTDNPPITNRETKWNLFSELRRILRQTSDDAIFSLFLSTAGRFNLFSPELSSDPSLRIQNSGLSTLDPITEISFDDLAYDAPEYKIMLGQVVEIDWMCHLGRPLFASIYDAVDNKYRSKIELMDLARAKLLDGQPTLAPNDRSGSLACLSVRFALEFNMDGTAGDVARTQVERHMRLCLAATAGRDTLVTLAGSEPLLAEAAYEAMKRTQSTPVVHLANHSDLNCVDRGRRGELVASLLIMRACDAARAASPGRRWVPVDVFMKELLPQAEYDVLKESFPRFYHEGQKLQFAATFKDHGIWFNHVIKVEKEKMFSADHLWKFITRGAMILCSDNQEGIDIVIPICHTQQALSRDSVTAILVQVKNSEKYQSRFHKSLFDRMNPIKLGLFPDMVVPKPVIRIVFSLTAVDTGVYIPRMRERDHHNDGFTAFDVWCAGLGDRAFKHIDGARDLASYRLLLERSLRPHDAFELPDDGKVHEKTRLVRGSLRRRMAPLTTDDDAHHAIHLRGSGSAA